MKNTVTEFPDFSLNKYIRYRYLIEKFLACILLLLLLPVIIITSIIISLDSGPIFFTQERLGMNGKKFKILKFRSMIVNADNFLDDQGMPTIDRITKVGKFIRKTSIDEFPQLYNIIRGEMSFIGPRPILPRMLPHMYLSEKKRFNIKPGLTGLAQVRGRNSIMWSKRFLYDVEYLENVTIWLDIKILIKTIFILFRPSTISVDRNTDKIDDVTTRTNKPS